MRITPPSITQTSRISPYGNTKRAAPAEGAEVNANSLQAVSKTVTPSQAEPLKAVHRVSPLERRDAIDEVAPQEQAAAAKAKTLQLSALLSREETEMLQRLFPNGEAQGAVASSDPSNNRIQAYLPSGATETLDRIEVGKFVDIRS